MNKRENWKAFLSAVEALSKDEEALLAMLEIVGLEVGGLWARLQPGVTEQTLKGIEGVEVGTVRAVQNRIRIEKSRLTPRELQALNATALPLVKTAQRILKRLLPR